MTIKKVLVTYDFTDETYLLFQMKEMGMLSEINFSETLSSRRRNPNNF